MRIASFCLAAILAVAGSLHAAAALDFPERPFVGGNTDPAWEIRLERTAAGLVEATVSSPRGVPLAKGTLASSRPVLDLPVFGPLKGQYGLAGQLAFGPRERAVQVLVGPSVRGRPCQDARRRKYGQAVIVVVGALSDPERLFYGCGEYQAP